MTTALGSDDVDRAAERMRRQTRFLADAFRDYERRVRESDGCDEHTLRERLIARAGRRARSAHVIVTVADWIADDQGLFVADFDLLTRIPGLESLDIVATEAILGSGFHERLHNWWPGLDEVGADRRDGSSRPTADERGPDAALSAADGGCRPDEPWWTFRDREEELVAIARRLKADRRDGEPRRSIERPSSSRARCRTSISRRDLRRAGIPYQTTDALPLAAEPTAAALDLVLEPSPRISRAARSSALLRSPHFTFRRRAATER